MELCHSPSVPPVMTTAHIPSTFSPPPELPLCLSSVEKETCSFSCCSAWSYRASIVLLVTVEKLAVHFCAALLAAVTKVDEQVRQT